MPHLIYHPESNALFSGQYDNGLAAQGCHIVRAADLPAGSVIKVGIGTSTALPDMDFETYSEAGYLFDTQANKWYADPRCPSGKRGLPAVGTPAYCEHPSARIISLAYNLKNGEGPKLWLPGMPPPQDLFGHIADETKLPIEAHNSGFEFFAWNYICVRMGWPVLPLNRLRCSSAKAKAFGLPGKLEALADVLQAADQKDKSGSRLINKLTKPKNPTQKDAGLCWTPETAPDDFRQFYEYNLQDINAESAVSALTPDLSEYEQQVWLLDQAINIRGVPVDQVGLHHCAAVLEEALQVYTAELQHVTCGYVQSAGQFAKVKEYANMRGVALPNTQKETCDQFLKRDDLPPDVRRMLEIRASIGSNSVKKINAFMLRISGDGHMRNLFTYYGAERTGRFSGSGVQPQNLPNSGPKVKRCDETSGCGRHFKAEHDGCPWCGNPGWATGSASWGPEAVDDALTVMACRDLRTLEHYFGDALETIGGCLRGLFCAGDGYELIASDFNAIEGVVAAALAGEEWRLEVFRTHGKIYEMSASKISGIPFETFMAHAGYTDLDKPEWWLDKQTGEDHPLRKALGKLAELASGFQGGVNAWLVFGAGKYFNSEAEILEAVMAWREASPNIVAMWKGLEQAAKAAIKNPGQFFHYRGIKYMVVEGVLYCRLLSGRKLCYQAPRIVPSTDWYGRPTEAIQFEGWNSDSTKGPIGWLTIDTFGGRLFENVVQATARDIMVNAMLNVEAAGYPLVLHVHDEPVSIIPEGSRLHSVEHYEALMVQLPEWCKDWPIRASGGWRGKRYRKD